MTLSIKLEGSSCMIYFWSDPSMKQPPLFYIVLTVKVYSCHVNYILENNYRTLFVSHTFFQIFMQTLHSERIGCFGQTKCRYFQLDIQILKPCQDCWSELYLSRLVYLIVHIVLQLTTFFIAESLLNEQHSGTVTVIHQKSSSRVHITLWTWKYYIVMYWPGWGALVSWMSILQE